MAIFNVQRAITPKVCNPELRFLRSARRLMVLNICVKFRENISNGFEVTERTRVCGENCHFSMFNGKNFVGNNFERMQFRVAVLAPCKSTHPP